MIVDTRKRALLYRKAHGKQISSRYGNKVNKIVLGGEGEDARLSLVETDEIIDSIKSKSWILLEQKNCDSFGEFVDLFFEKIASKECYLLVDDDWRYCGAVKILPVAQINKKFDFDECLSDEVRFVAVDFSLQATVDYSCSAGVILYECELRGSVLS